MKPSTVVRLLTLFFFTFLITGCERTPAPFAPSFEGLSQLEKSPESYAYPFEWGTYGSDDGQFRNPNGIALCSDGYIYVADHYNHRIQKFTSTGEFLINWGATDEEKVSSECLMVSPSMRLGMYTFPTITIIVFRSILGPVLTSPAGEDTELGMVSFGIPQGSQWAERDRCMWPTIPIIAFSSSPAREHSCGSGDAPEPGTVNFDFHVVLRWMGMGRCALSRREIIASRSLPVRGAL